MTRQERPSQKPTLENGVSLLEYHTVKIKMAVITLQFNKPLSEEEFMKSAELQEFIKNRIGEKLFSRALTEEEMREVFVEAFSPDGKIWTIRAYKPSKKELTGD